eukprot:m.103427 g.103427  ORF g.103427 m.103427 type:complete len:485 (-) comp18829_c0_seq2:496-1950(-)
MRTERERNRKPPCSLHWVSCVRHLVDPGVRHLLLQIGLASKEGHSHNKQRHQNGDHNGRRPVSGAGVGGGRGRRRAQGGGGSCCGGGTHHAGCHNAGCGGPSTLGKQRVVPHITGQLVNGCDGCNGKRQAQSHVGDGAVLWPHHAGHLSHHVCAVGRVEGSKGAPVALHSARELLLWRRPHIRRTAVVQAVRDAKHKRELEEVCRSHPRGKIRKSGMVCKRVQIHLRCVLCKPLSQAPRAAEKRKVRGCSQEQFSRVMRECGAVVVENIGLHLCDLCCRSAVDQTTANLLTKRTKHQRLHQTQRLVHAADVAQKVGVHEEREAVVVCTHQHWNRIPQSLLQQGQRRVYQIMPINVRHPSSNLAGIEAEGAVAVDGSRRRSNLSCIFTARTFHRAAAQSRQKAGPDLKGHRLRPHHLVTVAAVENHGVEQPLRQRRKGVDACADASGALAKQCHAVRVTAKVADVLLHPHQCCSLVFNAIHARGR